jgi:hypothetical protein
MMRLAELRRWMVFVDGENLTARAEEIARDAGIGLQEGSWYVPATFVWLPDLDPRRLWISSGWATQEWAIRAHYYASAQGDPPKIDSVRRALKNLGFHPQVFVKRKGEAKAKGVDIALTKDMLGHAFLNNYDVAVLFAGDGDYLPLVTEVQRLGKLVYLVFFALEKSGLNPELQIACDQFVELDGHFLERWRKPR